MRGISSPAVRAIAVSMAVLGLVACSDLQSEPPAEAAEAPSPGDELPPDHPPLTTTPAGQPPMTIAPPPTGSGSGATGLTWIVPEGWVEETPSSRMRKAQYRVGTLDGTAECVVFYFGPGQGGGAQANAERWANQFTQPDGRSSLEVMESRTIEVAGVIVLMVEVTGTTSGGGPMMGGSAEPQPDSMLLGAIAEGPDANWFFKLTGPEAVVRSQRQAFEGMILSLGSG